MSDVAQILGIAAPGAAGRAASAKHDLDQLKPTSTGTPRGAAASGGIKPKKLTGMQREVLELLESTHRVNHALYPGFKKTSLQQKWKEHSKSPAVKWLRKPFRNPARADLAGETESEPPAGLVLTHWMKAHIEPNDYVFARFNVKSEVTTYSKQEYETVLAPHPDPLVKWTHEETDLLFRLCGKFDLRWIVIADKYNTMPLAKGAFRSIEDIKYRYYEVTRLLNEHRALVSRKQHNAASDVTAVNIEPTTSATTTPGATPTPSAPSTPAATPASTDVVMANPSAAGSSTATPTSSAPAPTSDSSYRFNIVYEKQRKRQLELAFTRSVEEELEIKRLNEELRSVEQQLKKVAVKVDPKKKKELADVPYQIHRPVAPGVMLRSATLMLPASRPQQPGLSTKLTKKMDLMLEELGIPARPIPTKPVCEMFDSLRQEVVGLLSLRKHLAAKQADMQFLRDRYQSLTGTEFRPMPIPTRRADKRGDSAAGGLAAAASTTNTPAPISQGKALKQHTEKASRTSSKRRSSGATPGIPSKRNKKLL